MALTGRPLAGVAIPLPPIPAEAHRRSARNDRGLVVPCWWCAGRRGGKKKKEKPAFLPDWPIPAETVFAGGFGGVPVAGLQQASAATAAASTISQASALGWRLWPQGLACSRSSQSQAAPSPSASIHAAPFPFCGDEATALARLQHYGVRLHRLRRLQGPAATNWWARVLLDSSPPSLRSGPLSVRRIWQELLH